MGKRSWHGHLTHHGGIPGWVRFRGELGSRHLGEDRILRIILEENTEAVISELSYEMK